MSTAGRKRDFAAAVTRSSQRLNPGRDKRWANVLRYRSPVVGSSTISTLAPTPSDPTEVARYCGTAFWLRIQTHDASHRFRLWTASRTRWTADEKAIEGDLRNRRPTRGQAF